MARDNSRGISTRSRAFLMGASVLTLTACGGGLDTLDFDLRRGGASTADAALQVRGTRPDPDARGVISYPTYQVAVAEQGDTLTTLSARVGLPEAEVARYNGLQPGASLRAGEIVALPRRVAADEVDVTALAGAALDRVDTGTLPAADQQSAQDPGPEPIRHQVVRGETAYSIARLYGVPVRALADWNSLDSAFTVRQGQFLLIPPVVATTTAPNTDSAPGTGTPTPVPPSATEPLPDAPQTATTTPTSPNLAETRSTGAAMAMPADGRIVGAFIRGRSDGIDIAAGAGADVRAAAAGTVAAITRDVDQVPILVVRHENNLLTVYAGIDNIAVAKGDRVKRGQKIAEVRAGENAGLHFQVRQGTNSVDPMQYLN